jgi:hypothetical protein
MSTNWASNAYRHTLYMPICLSSFNNSEPYNRETWYKHYTTTSNISALQVETTVAPQQAPQAY